MLNRRQFLYSAASVAAGASLTGLYTRFLEPYWIDVVRRPMPIAGLPTALEGKTLVQLSDLHVGTVVPDQFILDLFRDVRAMAPDIVVYTGDFITHYARGGMFAQVERVYGDLPRGTLGTAAIFGNHDFGNMWSEHDIARRLGRTLTAAGVQVLSNETAVIGDLQIVGMGDLWAHEFAPVKAFATADLRQPAIVLSHNPDTVDLTGWGEFEGWILSGHTHGGQCKAPFLPPPILPVRNKRYSSGEFSLDHGRRLYINRGIGHALPVRINARPEVTVFSLTSV